MSDPFDSGFDMDDMDLTDEQIEALVAGADNIAGHDDLINAFAALRGLRDTQPEVPVSTGLAEFVNRPARVGPGSVAPHPVDPASVVVTQRDLVLEPLPATMSPNPPRSHGMVAGITSSLGAKVAIGGVVALASITGVHAAGIVDVPLLPGESEPVEVLVLGDADNPALAPAAPGATGSESAQQGGQADNAPTTEGSGAQPDSAAGISVDVTEGGVEIRLGDVSIAVSIEVVDGETTIDVQVDGVSPECEAAFESLEGSLDPSEMAAAGQRIEAACEDELGELLLDPSALRFDGELFGDSGFGMFFDEHFDPKKLEQFLEEWHPGNLPDFGEFGGIEPSPEDLEQFKRFFEQFDSSQLPSAEELQRFFDQLAPGTGAEGGLGFFFENFDPADLEGMFENFDPADLEGMFENFDPADLEGMFENFDPSDLEGMFENFDPADLEGMLENFDPSDLEGLLEQFGDVFGEPGPLPDPPAEEVDA